MAEQVAPAINDVPSILIFICSGISFVFGRSIFSEGASPDLDKDTIGSVFVVSLLYAVVVWIVSGTSGSFLLNPSNDGRWYVAIYAFALPAFLGAVYGILERWHVLIKILGWVSRKTGIDLPRTPTAHLSAWNAVFGDYVEKGDCVRVVMNDDTRFYGVLGENSHASASFTSAPDDLFIDRILEPDDKAGLSDAVPPKSMWIPYSQIKYIEFWSQDDLGEIPAEGQGDGKKNE